MNLAEKKRRLLEKSMRRPVNDVILDVQKGIINIDDFFKHIETKLKEKKDGKKMSQ